MLYHDVILPKMHPQFPMANAETPIKKKSANQLKCYHSKDLFSHLNTVLKVLGVVHRFSDSFEVELILGV